MNPWEDMKGSGNGEQCKKIDKRIIKINVSLSDTRYCVTCKNTLSLLLIASTKFSDL